MVRSIALLMMLMLALAGCDLGADQPPPAAEPSPSESEVVPSEPAPPDGVTVTGVLTGDAQLEGGCAWLDTDQGRIDPLWPSGYTETTNPVVLRGPDGEVVAEDGDEVTITGDPAQDLATICQVGEVWLVTDVTVPDAG
jgi:hypothetical protein